MNVRAIGSLIRMFIKRDVLWYSGERKNISQYDINSSPWHNETSGDLPSSLPCIAKQSYQRIISMWTCVHDISWRAGGNAHVVLTECLINTSCSFWQLIPLLYFFLHKIFLVILSRKIAAYLRSNFLHPVYTEEQTMHPNVGQLRKKY